MPSTVLKTPLNAMFRQFDFHAYFRRLQLHSARGCSEIRLRVVVYASDLRRLRMVPCFDGRVI